MSSLNLQVKIIHLQRSLERHSHIEEILLPQLHTTLKNHQNVKCEVFDAVDGFKEGENSRLLSEHGLNVHKTSMWQGQIGCFLSHFLLWKNLVNETSKVWLIVEDDTEISEKYQNTFDQCLENTINELNEHDPQWKWCYLWVNPDCDHGKSSIDGKHFVRPAARTYGTVAYLISREGAHHLIHYFLQHGINNAIDDMIMSQISDGTKGFYTSTHKMIKTVGPIYGHKTETDKLGSTICI